MTLPERRFPAEPLGGTREHLDRLLDPPPVAPAVGTPADLLEPDRVDVDLIRESLTVARNVLDQPVPAGSGDGFAIDPEYALQAVRRMDVVIDDLGRALVEMRHSLVFDPPGLDEVSLQLAANGRLMAERAIAYVQDWVAQVQAARDALQAQVEAYQQADRVRFS